MKITTYDLRYQNVPDMAYFSISQTPIKGNPKAYTFGFSYEACQWNELHKITSKFSYSTMQYRNGHRLKENVIGYGNIFIFDIDAKKDKPSYTAVEVVKAVKGLKSLIVSTRSHTHELPRLRLILLSDLVENVNMNAVLYKEVMLTIIDFCGLNVELLDKSCFSVDRQYAPNPVDQKHMYIDGKLLPMTYIMNIAIKRLKQKQEQVKIKHIHIPSSLTSDDFKSKRMYIKENLSFELMRDVLVDRGLTVCNDGKVIVPNNETKALSVDKTTGMLRDFANERSYDPVSVLHDYYGVPLHDATNYIYRKMGGAI